MADRELENVTNDVIFGTLATDELRLEESKRRSRGLWHGDRIEPIDPAPGDAVMVTVTAGNDLSIRGMVVRFATDGSMPDRSSPALPMTPAGPRWDTLTWGYVEDWTAQIPAQDDGVLVRYRIQAQAIDGREIWAESDPDSGEPGMFAYGVDRAEVPHWFREAVIYHIVVDHFAPDPGKVFFTPNSLNDTWGGTIKGVTAHLDHISNLGATAIWLSPVFSSPSRHGYDATNYTSIEPRLGTEEDLLALIDAAREHGIRVLIDVETMPQVSVDHDPATNYLIDAARYWLERGVDGFRLGYANGSSHAFWARFRRALREVKPDVALVGEIVESADIVASYEGRLDGALDFLLLQQIRDFFAFDQISAEEFWRFLERHLAWMPGNLSLPSFLDNLHMNRFLWVAKGDVRRLKIAALVQCALPHPPVIYYGTEVGLSQWHDLEYPDGSRRMEESRTPMLWGAGQNSDLRSFYRSLVFWRVRQGIASGTPMHVYAGDGGLLCFRTGQWFIVVNRSEEDTAIDFREHGEVWLVLGTEFDVQLHGSALQLPPMSGAVLRA